MTDLNQEGETMDMVTVSDLKQILETMTDTDVVVLSKDDAGNGYSPLAGAWAAVLRSG